eukprot:CCRYP_006742-RA/>CCRYP_006742-RA protein AED:0.28 eAED:0.28 QI:0/-1/0/1/-1/0/1/0/37
MKMSIPKDNAGQRSETLPPQFTSSCKHYAIQTIWFRE